MTPASSVAAIAQREVEPCIFAQLIAALCDQVTFDRFMQHNPVTPEEVQLLLSKGTTVFHEIRGRCVDIRLEEGKLNLTGFVRLHGMKALDDAQAVVSGRPNIRI